MPGPGHASLDSPVVPTKTIRSETACYRPETQEFYRAGAYQLLPRAGVVLCEGGDPGGFMWVHQEPLDVRVKSYHVADGIGPICHVVRRGLLITPDASEEHNRIHRVYPGTQLGIDPCSYTKGLVIPSSELQQNNMASRKIFDMRPRPTQESKTAKVTPPQKPQQRIQNNPPSSPPPDKGPPPRMPQRSPSNNGRKGTHAGIQRKIDYLFDFTQAPPKLVKTDEPKPPTPPLRAGQKVIIPTGKIKIDHGGQQTLSPNQPQPIYPWEVPSAVRILWGHKDQNKRKPYHNTPVMVHDAKTRLQWILMPPKSQIESVVEYPFGTNKSEFPDFEVLNNIVTSGPTCYLVTGLNSGLLVPVSTSKDRIAVFIRRMGEEEIDFSDPKCLASIPAGATVVNFFSNKVCAEIKTVQPGDSSIQVNLFEYSTRTPDLDSIAAATVARDFRTLSMEQKAKDATKASQRRTHW